MTTAGLNKIVPKQKTSKPPSSSRSNTPGVPAEYYLFSSKSRTDRVTFEKYVQELDRTTGDIFIDDAVSEQIYTTFLTAEQVEDVKSQPWLNAISEVTFKEHDVDEDYCLVDFPCGHPASSREYSFRSKYGTDMATFAEFIRNLDDNKGSAIMSEGSPWQTYITFLTRKQVDEVKSQPWFSSIAEVEAPKVDTGAEDYRMADSPEHTHHIGFTSKSGTEMATFVEYVKNLDGGKGHASIKEGAPWQMYLARLTHKQISEVKSQPWFASMSELGYPKLDVYEGCLSFDTRQRSHTQRFDPSKKKTDSEDKTAIPPSRTTSHQETDSTPPRLYTLRSKYGTDKETFHEYIRTLGDYDGSVVADSGLCQSYTTKLTMQQLEDVLKQDWATSITEVQSPVFGKGDECPSNERNTGLQ